MAYIAPRSLEDYDYYSVVYSRIHVTPSTSLLNLGTAEYIKRKNTMSCYADD